MEDQHQQQHHEEAETKGPLRQQQQQGPERSEAVRSRWTPKPEQILILESIFNNGMVNPPKDETVRIRKVLEKFGAVGDANVFYWFQNRRSRSRRRQRQMMQQQQQQQAAAAAVATTINHPLLPQPHPHPQAQAQDMVGGGAISHDHHNHNNIQGNNVVATNSTMGLGFGCSPCFDLFLGSSSSGGSSGGSGGQQGMDDFFSVSPQLGFPHQPIDHTSPASSVLYPPLDPNFSYHPGYGSTNISGFITVFINGVATELPKGPIDLKTVFGDHVMLIHSSGVPIPTNEFGFLMQNLQHGESYFLVPKPT